MGADATGVGVTGVGNGGVGGILKLGIPFGSLGMEEGAVLGAIDGDRGVPVAGADLVRPGGTDPLPGEGEERGGISINQKLCRDFNLSKLLHG